jgi:PqqD family protein of HPr-rel-A system
LIFSDVDCNACTQFLPEIAQWQRERSDITIAVVSRGTLVHNLAKGTAVGVTTLLVAADRELARSYGAYNTPSGILISADGHIASDVAEGATAIRGLLESAFELAIQSTQGDTKDLIPPVAPFDGADRQAEASITTTPIGIQSRPKPHPEVATTELDGEAVVYDPRNGQVHQLNPTAALVWSLCDGELAVVDMAETIAEAYGIPTEDAAADIDELLTKFSSAGLLVLA